MEEVIVKHLLAGLLTLALGSLALAPAVPATAAIPTSTAPSASGPPRNPFLAADTYAVSHFDPAQTDAFPYRVPRGTFHADLRTAPRVVQGPINIMAFASPVRDRMWGVSTAGVAYIDTSANGFREIARVAGPGMKAIPPDVLTSTLGQPFTDSAQVQKAVTKELGLDWTRIPNGVYSVVDKDNVVYANYGKSIVAFGLMDPIQPEYGVKVLRSIDVSEMLEPGDHIVGVNLTYDGKLVVLANHAMAIVDRSMTGQRPMLRFAHDEYISNSVAVDERNGIYVASDRFMRKIVWTGAKLSEDEGDGAWIAPYDTGREPPTVKFGTGTGSTPTLMGFGADPDKLVVITDGADRMKLVAFWRDAIPAGAHAPSGAKSSRMAGEIQVTCGLSPMPEFIQSEQSVVVNGYGAFVVNNVAAKGEKDRLVDVVALGPVNPPPKGVQRFAWDPGGHAWKSVWARGDVVSTSMVPTVSSGSGIVFVNGYTHADGWEVTGLDWATGKTVHRTIFGKDNLGNGAYAILQFFPNGDLLFNSIGGPARVALSADAARH
jgi:hypothetical protein